MQTIMINLLNKKRDNKPAGPAWLSTILASVFFSLNLYQASAQCANHPLSAPTSALSGDYAGNGDFSVLVFGNYSGTYGDIQGKVAIGGNFTFGHASSPFRVGTLLSAPFTNDNFVVNGEYTNYLTAAVQVRGNFKYRSSSGTPLPLHDTGEGTNSQFTGTLIDFSSLLAHYISLSNDYAALLPVPGASADFSGGTVTLTGTGAVADYAFEIDGNLGSISDIQYVNIPAGSTIKLTILGENITFTTGTNPDTFKDAFVVSLPEATQVQYSGFNLNGSLLAPLASLQILAQSKIDGRVVIGGNVAQQSAPFSFDDPCLNSSLPVTLTHFSVQQESISHILTWRTASESNFSRFDVLQSADARTWTGVGSVPGKGNNGSSYAFVVPSPEAGHYYRLKMIDLDGSFEHSPIVVASEQTLSFELYPNPSADYVQLRGAEGMARIFSSTGQVVFSKQVKSEKISINNLPSGIYYIEITSPNGIRTARKIIKQ